jgi:hypothetical protein
MAHAHVDVIACAWERLLDSGTDSGNRSATMAAHGKILRSGNALATTSVGLATVVVLPCGSNYGGSNDT